MIACDILSYKLLNWILLSCILIFKIEFVTFKTKHNFYTKNYFSTYFYIDFSKHKRLYIQLYFRPNQFYKFNLFKINLLLYNQTHAKLIYDSWFKIDEKFMNAWGSTMFYFNYQLPKWQNQYQVNIICVDVLMFVLNFKNLLSRTNITSMILLKKQYQN